MRRLHRGSLVHPAEDAKGGSPLSTPPANEQRRCAEKTSRISKAQVCLHHAEAAQGSLVHPAADAKGVAPFRSPPPNAQRSAGAEIRPSLRATSAATRLARGRVS